MANTQTEGTILIKPNFSQAPDIVEPGIYKVRIKSAKVKPEAWTTKDNFKVTQVAWTLETFGEAEDKNNGRFIFHRTDADGPFALGLSKFYKAVMGEELTGPFDATMLYGREVEVTVGPQRNNPDYNEVKAVKAITE